MIEIKHFKAKQKGLVISVLGAVHGNEKCGTIAINKFISELESGKIKMKSGEIYFAPICNPQAYNEHKRFCDVNLNRVIKNNDNPKLYEEMLAQELIALMHKCDFSIDLHSNHTSGIPFVFEDKSDAKTKELINCLPLESVLCGWLEIYEETDDVSTSDYMYQIGKFGVTIECGEHEDIAAIDIAYNSMINVFEHYGIIEGTVENIINKKYMTLTRFVKKPQGAVFTKEWLHGDAVKIGDEIGRDSLGNIYKSDINGYICLPFQNAEIGNEWFYLAVNN